VVFSSATFLFVVRLRNAMPVRAAGRDGKGLLLYFVSAHRVGQYSMKDSDRKRLQAVLH